MINPSQALLTMPGLVFGLTLHEAAHAWSAHLLGDDTPRRHGRISINPFHHLSLLGTAALFFIGFGWAKPVGVNVYNFKHPKRDYLLTSLAGPAANVLIVLACAGLMLLTRHTFYFHNESARRFLHWAHWLLTYTAIINVILAALNLLPLPPLDGSKIWPLLLPAMTVDRLDRGARISMFLLVLLLVTGRLDSIVQFVAKQAFAHLPQSGQASHATLDAAGKSLLASHAYEAAERRFSQALALDPADRYALLNRAEVRGFLHRFDEARTDLESAAKVSRGDPETEQHIKRIACWLHSMEGYLAYERGEMAEADKHYSAALQIVPDDRAALLNRASARMTLENWASALEDYDRVITPAEPDPAIYRSRAAVLRQLGRDAEAHADEQQAQALETARETRPETE